MATKATEKKKKIVAPKRLLFQFLVDVWGDGSPHIWGLVLECTAMPMTFTWQSKRWLQIGQIQFTEFCGCSKNLAYKLGTQAPTNASMKPFSSATETDFVSAQCCCSKLDSQKLHQSNKCYPNPLKISARTKGKKIKIK